ncbi:hypothetical protein K402DRAFT_398008 [Aulographum hederae CBS 113979]|uniref:Uncharacterized protein n=1 Tax=Aulographum hederae CBS 113979 TaxID=1176131 RepID=A0A6G1GLZ0_9PEZI|nr:hypothetical protein K402DRAFT_398008 [Aulographum hederae CBS 113979]
MSEPSQSQPSLFDTTPPARRNNTVQARFDNPFERPRYLTSTPPSSGTGSPSDLVYALRQITPPVSFSGTSHSNQSQPQPQPQPASMVQEREPPTGGSSWNRPAPQSSQNNLVDSTKSASNAKAAHSGPAPASNSPAVNALHYSTNTSPQFGTASPLRNPLKKPEKSIFYQPKPGQARPELHGARPTASAYSTQPSGSSQSYAAPYSAATQTGPPPKFTSSNSANQSNFRMPPNYAAANAYFQSGAAPKPTPDVMEIPRPYNFPAPQTIRPAPQPMFSTNFQSTSSAFASGRVDLTKDSDDPFYKALAEDRFGEADPFAYVDTAKANENIKALLEGAFDDEDDKPKRKLRSRKNKEDTSVDSLADKVKNLDVTLAGAKQEDGDEDEEEEDEDDGTVEGLSVKLLPHQVEGVAWMMDKEIGQKKKNGVLPRGGILADDMGLGKTIQSIALFLNNTRPSPKELKEMAEDKKNKNKIPVDISKATLVVAPLALIKQWESEIKTKVEPSHAMRVLVHHGPSRTKRADDLKKYDIVITTYQTLTSEHAGSSDTEKGIKLGCFGVHWYRIVLDEAHSIKNRSAKSTQACYALRAHYRWCLTGTPMQNNLDELQSLIKFLQIKPYCDLGPWKEQIITSMKNGRGGLAMKRLNFFLRAFMKRRTKDILKEEGALNPGGKSKSGEKKGPGFKIVERNVETVVAHFSPHEREFYERLMSRAQNSLDEMMGGDKVDYIGALVLLLRLRQACNHPQLMKASVTKDKDAISTATSTQPGSKSADKEADDLADMLGGLSVESKNCDVCKVKLSSTEVSRGSMWCAECAEDLDKLESKADHKVKKEKSKKKTKKAAQKAQKLKERAKRNRRVIDDDSEEDEGDWLVPENQRKKSSMGVAGDTDDENADGAGEFLDSDDSETDEDDEPKGRLMKKKAINLDSDDEADSEEEDASEDDEDDSDSSSSESEDGIYNVQVHKNKKALGNIQPSTKIIHLMEILRKETPNHKVIVFSQFTTMLDLIEPFMRQEGFAFTRYDGSMKNDLREASLERLRNDKKTRVLLCSLKCGSLGLNLTAASRVVVLEPFWNPFVEEQAIDRVHRLNQTVDVHVYKLTIANSVEERILELQESKRKLAKAAIEGGKGMNKLGIKDIMNLFRHDAEIAPEHADAEAEEGAVSGVHGRVLGERVEGVGRMGKAAGSGPSYRVPGGDGGVYGLGQPAGGERVRAPEKKQSRVEDPVWGRR